MKSGIAYWVLLISFLFVISSCGESDESRREREQKEIVYVAYLAEQNEKARREEEERLRLEQYRTCISNSINQYLEILQDTTYSLGTYALALEGISLNGCPSDYVNVFDNHISICRNAQKLINAREILNSQENTEKVLIQSLWSTIVGSESTPLMDAIHSDIELKKLLKEAKEEVRVSFESIMRVARKYGVE